MKISTIILSLPIAATGFSLSSSRINSNCISVNNIRTLNNRNINIQNNHKLNTRRTSSLILKSSERYNFGKGDSNQEEDEEDEVVYYNNANDEDDDDVDWRSFRAHLVSIYDQDVNTITPATNHHQKSTSFFNEGEDGDEEMHNSWIYETGTTIETGTVLLHRIDNTQDDDGSSSNSNAGYGLARQYLHKSVVLILEHEDNEHAGSSKGIILNRPTDLILHDHNESECDTSSSKQTKKKNNNKDNCRDDGFSIWYGGCDWGIHTKSPKFFCLHSVKSYVAKQYSEQVMNGIYFTSVQNAKDLVANGYAKPSDFWVFAGFMEWERGELIEEVEEGNWCTVATDGSIVKKGLKILTDADAIDIEHAGVQTWTMLMDLIHQNDDSLHNNKNKKKEKRLFGTKKKINENFDDLMFEEWAKRHLRFDEAPLFLEDNDELDSYGQSSAGAIPPGTLLRGSSSGFPFLLSEQEFHKSLVLVVQDDYELSAGLILNHPTSNAFDISLSDESGIFPKKNSISFPTRFGGNYGGPTIHDPENDDDDKPLFILHMSQALRDANIGEPIGDQLDDGVWSCTAEQCISAISNRLASPKEFMCVNGFCLWLKNVDESGKVVGGIGAEVSKGDFEVVPHLRVPQVWNSLLQQEFLSSTSIDRNFDIAESAWHLASDSWKEDMNRKRKMLPASEIESLLLNDEALRRWITVYLHDI